MEINVDILKQVTQLMDWLLKLPETLVGTVMGPQEQILTRKERIAKLRELAELREISKTIQSVAFFKGSLATWVEILQKEKPEDAAGQMRSILLEISGGLTQIAETISETSFASLAITAEAANYLGKASLLLQHLAQAPDHVLLSEDTLVVVAKEAEAMMENGHKLLIRVDEYRTNLDMHYG